METIIPQIKELDVVWLLEEIPEHGLHRGQIGTALDELAPGVFDVEFSNRNGETIALVPLQAEQLLVLHEESVKAE